jgi:hypothetical protein
MREKFLENKWGYEIHETPGQYGFRVDVYKNDILVYSQGGFGSINIAEIEARDYFLLNEFNIEREVENENF